MAFGWFSKKSKKNYKQPKGASSGDPFSSGNDDDLNYIQGEEGSDRHPNLRKISDRLVPFETDFRPGMPNPPAGGSIPIPGLPPSAVGPAARPTTDGIGPSTNSAIQTRPGMPEGWTPNTLPGGTPAFSGDKYGTKINIGLESASEDSGSRGRTVGDALPNELKPENFNFQTGGGSPSGRQSQQSFEEHGLIDDMPGTNPTDIKPPKGNPDPRPKGPTKGHTDPFEWEGEGPGASGGGWVGDNDDNEDNQDRDGQGSFAKRQKGIPIPEDLTKAGGASDPLLGRPGKRPEWEPRGGGIWPDPTEGNT